MLDPVASVVTICGGSALFGVETNAFKSCLQPLFLPVAVAVLIYCALVPIPLAKIIFTRMLIDTVWYNYDHISNL
jgi:hypothetical protein